MNLDGSGFVTLVSGRTFINYIEVVHGVESADTTPPTQDFIGASVSSTVKMNGHFHFHYDESLGRSGWAQGYVVNSRNEI